MTRRPSEGWFDDIQAVIFDMDGVVYRGDSVISEAPILLNALKAASVPFVMATNNATATPDDYVAKLARMGMDVPGEEILTSALATGQYLREHYTEGSGAYVVGMEALRGAVFGDGYFVEDDERPDVVVSGADFDLVFESLRTACLCIRAGADYVATNPDTTFPTEAGLIPGAGAIVAALVASGGKEPVVVGKPSPVMIDGCLKLLGTDAAQTLMIGDRLDTDILAANRAGTKTALVTTGVSSVADIETTGIEPNYVIESLAEITDALAARVR